MTILRFPGHHWAHCTTKDCPGCFLCEGSLSWCTTCGGTEASLPRECPGEKMTEATEYLVMAGTIDYRGGRWVDREGRPWTDYVLVKRIEA
jgi:hypothetical protein